MGINVVPLLLRALSLEPIRKNRWETVSQEGETQLHFSFHVYEKEKEEKNLQRRSPKFLLNVAEETKKKKKGLSSRNPDFSPLQRKVSSSVFLKNFFTNLISTGNVEKPLEKIPLCHFKAELPGQVWGAVYICKCLCVCLLCGFVY